MSNLEGDKLNIELVALAEDPDANRANSLIAIERAMAEYGLSREKATEYCGFVEPTD